MNYSFTHKYSPQLVQEIGTRHTSCDLLHCGDFGRSNWYSSLFLHLKNAPEFLSYSGGLLAAAISNMNGVAGKPAWAWIFIIEGGITILIGVASFWVLQDFPVSAKFLTAEERQYKKPCPP